VKRTLPLLLACAPVFAQQADCPAARELQPRQAIGTWRAEVEGAEPATLLLRPHARYRESLSGLIDRAGKRAQVAADLDGGELTLEESDDGVRISATWLGEVVDGSCGREIRGTWEPAGGQPRPFRLRR
jgi:hypothetical protein